MKKIVVQFNGPDPTKTLFNSLPTQVIDYTIGNTLPVIGGSWVIMTKPELHEYIARVRLKESKLLLVPNTGDIGYIKSEILAGLNAEQLSVLKNYMKRQFGDLLKAKLIDMLGGRNVYLGKDGAFVMQMNGTLSGIGGLMSGGALKTAMNGLISIRPLFIQHTDIIDFALDRIKIFLASIEDL